MSTTSTTISTTNKSIINPVTGRWVLKHGKIGQKLNTEDIFASQKQYKTATALWDKWALADDDAKQNIPLKAWDPMLKDVEKPNVYPFYLKSYLLALRKACKFL